MLKAVPDANILVSALISSEGNSAKICARVIVIFKSLRQKLSLRF